MNSTKASTGFQPKKSMLETKADSFAHLSYKLTRSFPPEERFGHTSQLRRSAISVVLNIVEGFARKNQKEHLHFLRIAYGSLREAAYLIEFCKQECFFSADKADDYQSAMHLADQIGAMLWKTMSTIEQKIRLNKE
jgi:four helix bundle protein